MDGETCRANRVDLFPTYVLIGPDGNVVLTSNEDREPLMLDLNMILRRYLHAAGRLGTPRSKTNP